MTPIEVVKRYPVPIAIGAIVIIGAVYIYSRSGSSAAAPMSVQLPGGASGPSDASIMAGMQIQALGIQSKAHESELLATKEVSLATIAADLKKAEYAKLTSFHIADVTAASHARDVASDNYKSLLDFKLDFLNSNNAVKTATIQSNNAARVAIGAQGVDKYKANLSYNLAVKQNDTTRITLLTQLKNALTLGLSQSNNALTLGLAGEQTERIVSGQAYNLGMRNAQNAFLLGNKELDIKKLLGLEGFKVDTLTARLNFTSNANALEQARTLEKLRITGSA